ncbi:MAG TPA: M64 family metallopeptidase [Dokdonella sp.]|uniref:M64 family metallopeptidase n=1 Tax=Dokdonella sp. TaxID=2291710 RepID=UPI0025C4EBC6|nr:M64 family metallopeptidase [Dokdonella sp.]MBX3692255.1 hypothetical protein [Dokdonella sp.]MCW5567983.1 hypothetical protein [Dokdonella sp.]HNR91463.1 M64 family metallopeptidase [Dokdonella sp.]
MRTMMLRKAVLAGALATGPAWAVPAHYVVFGFDAQGRIEPRFHATVELADDASTAVALSLPDHLGNRLNWHALKDGQRGARREVEVSRVLRAEFAHDIDSGHGEIDGQLSPDPDPAFVLRVPVAEAEVVEFETTAGMQRFDLAALAADAARLPLAGGAQARIEAPSSLAGAGGSPANRVDILVLGDGYTSGQEALFNTHVAALEASMFNVTPYKEYANFVNWRSGFIASAQSGADHPLYLAGCVTTSCCADSAAQGDPLAGQFVDTALDGRFCTNQIHRLLTVSSAKVFAAAAAYPNWDKLLVTVNDPVYGGSGGSYATVSAHAQAPLVAIHEYGHSFHKLADEYTTPYPGFPACSDLGTPQTCEANVTNQNDATLVKWRSWFTPGIAIPTPAGTPGTGLFEGARYLVGGMYRPTSNSCLMRVLGSTFCNVCRQEYVKFLYRGGFGTPAAGIDLIEPGTESPSPATPVIVPTGTPRTFSATILRPVIGTVSLQWYLDGVPIAGATGESHVFSQAVPTPAVRTLELRAIDTTPFVNAEMADGLTTHVRTWTIQISNDLLFKHGFE